MAIAEVEPGVVDIMPPIVEPTPDVELYLSGADGFKHRVPVFEVRQSDDLPGFDAVSLQSIHDAISRANLSNAPESRVFLYIPRQENGDANSLSINDGQVSLNLASRELSLYGRAVKTSRLEFDLLAYFLRHQDQAISREQLLAGVWGDNAYRGPGTVTEHVRKIRNKLGWPDGQGRSIQGVTSIGYKCVDLAKLALEEQ